MQLNKKTLSHIDNTAENIPKLDWTKYLGNLHQESVVYEKLRLDVKTISGIHTVPIDKILNVKNARALNSTAIPAHFHQNWAGLAKLFSRQIEMAPRILISL